MEASVIQYVADQLDEGPPWDVHQNLQCIRQSTKSQNDRYAQIERNARAACTNATLQDRTLFHQTIPAAARAMGGGSDEENGDRDRIPYRAALQLLSMVVNRDRTPHRAAQHLRRLGNFSELLGLMALRA